MKTRPVVSGDLFVLIACGMIVASLACMRLQTRRSLARTSQCANNLKQLGLGIHNYHAAYRQMPSASGGTNGGSESEPLRGNANRLSAFVGLTPFLEEQRVWEMVSNPHRSGGVSYPPMGPVPWHPPEQYPPWAMRSNVLACPTDPDVTRFPTASSYVINYGDGVIAVGAPWNEALKPYVMDRHSKRGAFIRQSPLRFRDFLDGTSNTLLLSEARVAGLKIAKDVSGLGLNPSLCIDAATKPGQDVWPDGRNACWADGSLRSIGFQTILPPNSPSATSNLGELEAVMSASSHHAGGVHVLFCDGSVRFTSSSIDCGDIQTASVATPTTGQLYSIPGSQSPYGLWGAIGTRASREVVDTLAETFREPSPEISKEEQEAFLAIPIETWTLADGSVLRGRLYDVISNARVMIVPEKGDAQTIPLSNLKSEDAYRAVKQHLQIELQANREILTYLQRAVELLEKKDFDGFIDESVSSEISAAQRRQLKDQLPTGRGMFIQQFDQVIMGLRDGSLEVKMQNGGDAVEVRSRQGSLKLRRENGSWRLAN